MEMILQYAALLLVTVEVMEHVIFTSDKARQRQIVYMF